jgi:hypothetical protein
VKFDDTCNRTHLIWILPTVLFQIFENTSRLIEIFSAELLHQHSSLRVKLWQAANLHPCARLRLPSVAVRPAIGRSRAATRRSLAPLLKSRPSHCLVAVLITLPFQTSPSVASACSSPPFTYRKQR